MEDRNKKEKNTRREFLEAGATAAAGVALGLAVGNILQPKEPAPEMVKMLTADGKLVAVEKRHLPPMCGKSVTVSNVQLKQWMEKDKQ
jgi:hypothetical protein